MLKSPRRRILHTAFGLRLSLCLSLGTALSATAADPNPVQVKVALFAVPETIWQAKLDGQYRDHTDLHTRLEKHLLAQEAERVVHVLCTLKGDGEPFEWKRGETRKFTTGWQVLEKGLGVKPEKFTDRFIGTTLGITNERVHADGTFTLDLALEHHTAPPAMRRINFAQAAEGAERDRLSVAYPAFTKLEWSGRTAVTPDWRLVANMLYAPEESADEKENAKADPGAAKTDEAANADAAPAPAPAQRHLLFIIRAMP